MEAGDCERDAACNLANLQASRAMLSMPWTAALSTWWTGAVGRAQVRGVGGGAPLALTAAMLAPCMLLLAIGLLGAFDVFHFHRPARLTSRRAACREAWLHVARGVIWRITQDHRLHPTWDHRFTEITMLSAPIMTGTCMRYEKRIAGMVVRGFGRYKLHRAMQQSTFEFWSDDRRSPIRRGVGLWRYVPAADGSVEFRTSYTYDVRWGLLGRVLDRVILRRWFQRETERSFARLRRAYFAGTDTGAHGPVAGRRGRKPEALAA
jgi:hypothetical protein